MAYVTIYSLQPVISQDAFPWNVFLSLESY